MNIHGIGELIYDHIFEDIGSALVYRLGGGGGSLGNFLCNVADSGFSAVFHSVIGGNQVGAYAEAHAMALGVKKGNVLIDDGKNTRIIFETLTGARAELLHGSEHAFSERHRFQTTCLICESRETESQLARFDRNQSRAIVAALKTGDVLYMDRLTSVRCDLAREFKRKSNGLVVLDIGRASYLRFIPESKLLNLLGPIDIVFAPKSVFLSLRKRFAVANDAALLNLLGDKLLLYSGGSSGLEVLLRDKQGKQWQSCFDAPKVNNLVDDAGAGDAFLAYFICALVGLQSGSNKKKHLDSESVAQAVTSAKKRLPGVLLKIGARGHLSPSAGPWQYLQMYRDDSVETIRGKIDLHACPFCHRRAERPKRGRIVKKNTFRANVDSLLTRIAHKALDVVSTQRIREIIAELGRCTIVGTGGSYSVAVFLEMLINNRSDSFARACHPLEYIRQQKHSDSLIVISYSGKTKDCEAVLKLARKLRVTKMYIVSGKADTLIGREYGGLGFRNVVSYENGGALERGFVSIRGTVLPCALFTLSFIENELYRAMSVSLDGAMNQFDGESFISTADQFVTEWVASDNAQRMLEVYGTGWAKPAMVDLESKLVEGGVGFVRLHESKDFSHGRFMSVLTDPARSEDATRTFCIIFRSAVASSYEEKLIRVLKENGTVLVVETRWEEELGALDLLMRVQFLIKVLARKLQIDVSKPQYVSPTGLELYRWKVLT
jgi:sugar/nucleoside kinase (ribokinase family)